MFMAPEMILNVGYTTLADLWSLGICLYEFLLGRFPFANDADPRNQPEIFREVLHSPLVFPESWKRDPGSKHATSILQGLLTKEPTKRLGAQVEGYTAIKKHSFFNGLDWEMLMGRQLRPPYVPNREVYAEDKDGSDSTDALASKMTVEEEEALHDEDDDWEDPDPDWDAGF